MPAYNFQKQFVPMILDGSKHHTIRRRRKRATVARDQLMLYTGMRTKQCVLIAVAECIDVQPISIYPFRKQIVAPIDVSFEQFVRNDGFESCDDFFKFFQRYKCEELNDFEIIYWNTETLVNFWEVRDGG